MPMLCTMCSGKKLAFVQNAVLSNHVYFSVKLLHAYDQYVCDIPVKY